MKIYLDSCCYNRPYDNQGQLRIHIETLAKMKIQKEVIEQKHLLVTSVVLYHENDNNRDEASANQIESFMDTYSDEYIDEKGFKEAIGIRNEIITEGAKKMDASHIACAIHAKCDYFITTDDKVLKLNENRIKIINPVDFISIEEAKE